MPFARSGTHWDFGTKQPITFPCYALHRSSLSQRALRRSPRSMLAPLRVRQLRAEMLLLSLRLSIRYAARPPACGATSCRLSEAGTVWDAYLRPRGLYRRSPRSRIMAQLSERPETALRTGERPGEAALHRIVVVGGGAAGLELATRLGDRLGRRARASVTLVECARTHLWKPLLHAVAAGSIDPGEYEVNYLGQAHWHRFRYRLGEMIGLVREKKEVRLAAALDEEGRQITPPRSVGYDTLVIAVGSITNDFGTTGVAEYAVPLETAMQAARFNRRLVNACLRAQTQ